MEKKIIAYELKKDYPGCKYLIGSIIYPTRSSQDWFGLEDSPVSRGTLGAYPEFWEPIYEKSNELNVSSILSDISYLFKRNMCNTGMRSLISVGAKKMLEIIAYDLKERNMFSPDYCKEFESDESFIKYFKEKIV
jgi:hypothetical protein